MNVHHVKSWSHFWDAIAYGDKKHDLRKLDRPFKRGDIVKLYQYDNVGGRFTGRTCQARITYVTSNQHPCAYSSAVLPKDYCILSLAVIGTTAKENDFTYDENQPKA